MIDSKGGSSTRAALDTESIARQRQTDSNALEGLVQDPTIGLLSNEHSKSLVEKQESQPMGGLRLIVWPHTLLTHHSSSLLG